MQKTSGRGYARQGRGVYPGPPAPAAMNPLLRLQHAVALTHLEARTLAVLGGLLLLGLAAQRLPVGSSDAPGITPQAERFALLADSLGAAGLAAAAFAPPVAANAGPPPSTRSASRPRPRAPKTDAVRVDINAAGQAELERLPRIGPAIARRILALRAERGAFGSVDELRQVKGIGPKTLDRLRPHAFVAE